jgi:hypothetical protein
MDKKIIVFAIIGLSLAIAGYFLYRYLKPASTTGSSVSTSASSSKFVGRESYHAAQSVSGKFKSDQGYKIYNK